jgi:hypothetical protein
MGKIEIEAAGMLPYAHNFAFYRSPLRRGEHPARAGGLLPVYE